MESKKICPTCNGKKIIQGNCECNMEWRGSERDDGWEDCICEPDRECPDCKGTGFVE